MEPEKQQGKLVDPTYPGLFLSFVISVQARGNLIALREPVRSDERSVTGEPGTCSLASSAHTSTGPGCWRRAWHAEKQRRKTDTPNSTQQTVIPKKMLFREDNKGGCEMQALFSYVIGKSASIRVFFLVAYHLSMLVNAR